MIRARTGPLTGRQRSNSPVARPREQQNFDVWQGVTSAPAVLIPGGGSAAAEARDACKPRQRPTTASLGATRRRPR